MKKLIILLSILVLLPGAALAGDSLISVYAATALTGGATGALDKIAVALLDTGDAGMVSVAGDKVYHYVYDASSSTAESSPGVIKPDDNASDGRWILTGVYIPSGTYAAPLGGDDNYVTDAQLAALHADESAASTTVVGVVELAIASEVTTGTSDSLAVTPDALAGSILGQKTASIKICDDATALTTGDGKFHFFIPPSLNGFNLVGVSAGVSTVSSSGLPEVDIYNVTGSEDMLSTNLTIDANEKHSSGATTAAVINASYDDMATGQELRIDVDVAGTGTKGLQVDLIFQLP